MSKKFEITGRQAGQTDTATAEMARFIRGEEPMTTMTVQIPERLKRMLKQAALDRDTTVKELLIEILEGHFAAIKE
jgi:hypothetical protein